ncbi:hypothetical protein MINTMi198_17250 [Mycobacterium intracellulare M.i.198]|uniref:hypothetical protein n=1 Tax=Mycobacterium intracellulare TaxID=1767 RepID=UPI0003767F7E|nr:hypothetical protein [Mycobacterium intracellulare]BCP36355.1 hypothetical protein MINTMi198_17250 [Mycobacterium intracellulare M.i.198]
MSSELEDTQALDPRELQDDPVPTSPDQPKGTAVTEDFDTSDVQDTPTVEKIMEHLPSPTEVRAVAIALVSVVAAGIGRDVNITPIIDSALAVYTLIVPFGLSIWFGRKVKKVSAVTPPST